MEVAFPGCAQQSRRCKQGMFECTHRVQVHSLGVTKLSTSRQLNCSKTSLQIIVCRIRFLELAECVTSQENLVGSAGERVTPRGFIPHCRFVLAFLPPVKF